MSDIEANQSTPSPSNINPQTLQDSKCQIGSFTSVCVVVSVVVYFTGLSSWLTFFPDKWGVLSVLTYSWFPFAVNTSGFLANLVILLFFSTFFEKKFGSLGFFLKLEFFKVLFVLLSVGLFHFFSFVHPSPSLSKMLSLGDFAVLFMILVSQEAFERPNDFSMIPLVNVSFKNVSANQGSSPFHFYRV